MIDEKVEKLDAQFLTEKERQFCRIYVKAKIANSKVKSGTRTRKPHTVAAEKVFSDHVKPSSYGQELIKKPKILDYIDYLESDAEFKLDLGIEKRAKMLREAMQVALDLKKMTAYGSLSDQLNTLLGRRRKYSFNLKDHKTIDEKVKVLEHALATGDLCIDDFNIYMKALANVKEREQSGQILVTTQDAVLTALKS